MRGPTPQDEEEFLALASASTGLHAPWTSAPSTPDAYRRYLQRTGTDEFQGYLLVRRSDGAIVGCANLSHIFHGNFKNAHLGFFAFAENERRGYMTEGLNAVLRHAFRTLRLHRVEANVQPGNARSSALLGRLGFRHEGFSPRYLKIGGRWRGHDRWAMLAEEWEARHRRKR